jgi:hypothetical protein
MKILPRSTQTAIQTAVQSTCICLVQACSVLAQADAPQQHIAGPRLFAPRSAPIRPLDRAPERPTPATRAAAADRMINEMREENNRLRRLLQNMELDRLRALHNAVPVEEAFALREAIWINPAIDVTWENPEAAPDAERGWVRDAVERTWQAACGLQFNNWGKSQPNSSGIRIRIADEGPHCKRLGSKLDGLKDGMVLNFTFQNWCTQCAGPGGGERESAIRKIAVHEFGHAIGFAHEQNRPEAPELCQLERQGSNGDWIVTLYDPQSIMNYCNPEWNNAGLLSELDKAAALTIYGPPLQPRP